MRSLAFNIGRSSEKMDIKQCADILYALAVLNFPDEVLLEKVSADLRSTLITNDRTSVIGSILTSIGILRYRDPGNLYNIYLLVLNLIIPLSTINYNSLVNIFKCF